MARFYRSPRWKHIVTKRDTEQISDFSRLIQDRRIRFELDGPSYLEGVVPADDPRVNLLTDDDFTIADFDPFYIVDEFDYPRLAEGVRLLYSFRREADDPTEPWVLRHAGPILEVEDSANPDRRLTRLRAFSAWQLLYQRPALVPTYEGTTGIVNGGELPSAEGINYIRVPRTGAQTAPTGDQIACELLAATIIEHGSVGIDAGLDFAGTGSWNGTITTTDVFAANAQGGTNEADYANVAVNFPPGTTVGAAWDQLVGTGTMHIYLNPIWDPIDRPGYTHDLSIFPNVFQDGEDFDPFAPPSDIIYPTWVWDRSGRSLVEISRLQDGTQRANNLQFYGGGTGVGGKVAVSLQTDAQSVERFGESWLLGQVTNVTTDDRLSKTVQDELFRRRIGVRSWRLKPTPEFSPRPFQDFDVGYFCSFYHSSKLREEQWIIPVNFADQRVFPRITGFTLELSNDSLETVAELDISLDIPASGLIE